MGEERKRQSLADTLRAKNPIAGAALASTASAIRLISAPPEAMPETAPTDVPSQAKPVIRSVTRPLSQPLSPSLSHSASHSASLSLDPSQGPSLSQSRVADRLTKYQRDILSYLLATRPYIIRYAQLGQAVGLGKATTRTILRRLADLNFITFQRERDGQIQGVSISFNASLCEQFTQGHSLRQSSSQPVIKPLSEPLASKKIDLKEEINLSKDEPGERLLRLSDETFAQHWPDVFAVGFGTDDIRLVVESRRAVGKSNSRLVEGLDHADFELRNLREHNKVRFDHKGIPVENFAKYLFNSLCPNGYYMRPKGYVSPAEQREKDAEEEARRVVEAHKKRKEAEFEAWCCGLTPEEKEVIFKEYTGKYASEEFRLRVVWEQRLKKASQTGFDSGDTLRINAQSAQATPS